MMVDEREMLKIIKNRRENKINRIKALIKKNALK